jgi:hypothetical protein
MILREMLNKPTLLRIGQNTLAIYVIHFILLYGSFTGLGLYRFFHHSLSPSVIIPGALLFMFSCSFLALQYDRHENLIKAQVSVLLNGVRKISANIFYLAYQIIILLQDRILRIFSASKS